MSKVLDLFDSFSMPIPEKRILNERGSGRLSEWSTNVEIKDSAICGKGLFAKNDIAKGELLCEMNYSSHNIIPIDVFWSFDFNTRNELYRHCWQIDHYELIGPNIDEKGNIVDKENMPAVFLLNHSSNPNAWFEGDENIVAMKDIKKGEEILIDYAMIEANGLGQCFEAKGEKERRKKFSLYDFESLWEEYKEHTHSYVYKMAKFIQSHTFGPKNSPFFCLHHHLTSKIHPMGFGRGLFATGEIKKGEILWLERDEKDYLTYLTIDEIEKLEDTKKNWVLHFGYQVDYNMLALPQSLDVMEDDHSYLMNHSCDPNSVFYNTRIIIAFKDVKVGEEVTFDYATSDTVYDSLEVCCCGAENCRKKVTKEDYAITGLKEKYENFWQPYILGMFAREGIK